MDRARAASLDEARFIDNHQNSGTTAGRLPSAILYRNSAQSRVLEERYCRRCVSYLRRMRFFERGNQMRSYLRLIASSDDAAFERCGECASAILVTGRGTSDGDRQLTLCLVYRELLQKKPSPDVLPAHSGLWS